MTLATVTRLAILLFLAALAGPACTQAADGDDDDISVCGNRVCDERPSTCPEDCDDEEEVDAGRPIDAGAVCGNNLCELNEPTSCPGDCTVCGNGQCELNEPTNCPGDCTVCGNGQCELNEPSSCPGDCTVCGNAVCETGESFGSCASDCASRLILRNNSSYPIYELYVGPCSGTWGSDLVTGSIPPAGGTFTVTNIPPGCWYFRAEGSGTLYWQTPSAITLSPGGTYTWTLVN